MPQLRRPPTRTELKEEDMRELQELEQARRWAQEARKAGIPDAMMAAHVTPVRVVPSDKVGRAVSGCTHRNRR